MAERAVSEGDGEAGHDPRRYVAQPPDVSRRTGRRPVFRPPEGGVGEAPSLERSGGCDRTHRPTHLLHGVHLARPGTTTRVASAWIRQATLSVPWDGRAERTSKSPRTATMRRPRGRRVAQGSARTRPGWRRSGGSAASFAPAGPGSDLPHGAAPADQRGPKRRFPVSRRPSAGTASLWLVDSRRILGDHVPFPAQSLGFMRPDLVLNGMAAGHLLLRLGKHAGRFQASARLLNQRVVEDLDAQVVQTLGTRPDSRSAPASTEVRRGRSSRIRLGACAAGRRRACRNTPRLRRCRER